MVLGRGVSCYSRSSVAGENWASRQHWDMERAVDGRRWWDLMGDRHFNIGQPIFLCELEDVLTRLRVGVENVYILSVGIWAMVVRVVEVRWRVARKDWGTKEKNIFYSIIGAILQIIGGCIRLRSQDISSIQRRTLLDMYKRKPEAAEPFFSLSAQQEDRRVGVGWARRRGVRILRLGWQGAEFASKALRLAKNAEGEPIEM
ncbi:hypothetical protein BDN70DRAFT_926537 [Pholiota conissans]|uniref:Uncharacterized protein n=1 Tax=Pholiota conissans TaxID=109636 RepID=A0A9P5YJM3_9AGAR|nr:hypothetical protein BDN70DRAFT_926537 [Pholiota conissans]